MWRSALKRCSVDEGSAVAVCARVGVRPAVDSGVGVAGVAGVCGVARVGVARVRWVSGGGQGGGVGVARVSRVGGVGHAGAVGVGTVSGVGGGHWVSCKIDKL